MVHRLFADISPRSQPLMARQSYSHELTHAMSWPVSMAMLEGAVVSMLAKLTFDVGPWAFATIVAAPMFANLTSFIWARLARGRRKIPFLVMLHLGVLAVIGSIALLPLNDLGRTLLPILVVFGRCMQAGIVTIRSAVWRMNYPRHLRAQISGNLVRIYMLIMIAPPLIGYALQDANANAFRIIYPASLLFGLFGVSAYAKIRLRHERGLLMHERREKETLLPGAQRVSGVPTQAVTVSDLDAQDAGVVADDDEESSDGDGGPRDETEAMPAPTGQSATVWTVLRSDVLFRRYLMCQFIAGMSTMMGETVLYAWIADQLDRETVKLSHLLSILLTHSAPLLVAVLTLSLWAKYLDRVHIVRYRSRASLITMINQALNWLGTTTIAAFTWPVIALARVSQGVSRGAGTLAWQLGHNDFSHRHHTALYMGIHVTLTGVRGAIAPFAGIALYGVMGTDVFAVTTALAIISSVGFFLLNRTVEGEPVR